MNNTALYKELAECNEKLRAYEEELAKLNQRVTSLKRDTIRDRTSNLYSNAYFYTRLVEEILRSERYRHFLSLILIHLNPGSDQTTRQMTRELRKIGAEITESLTRRTDIVATYRQRQLIVMLPETDPHGAEVLVQRYQSSFPDNGRQLDYSVLTYPNDATNIELMLARLQENSDRLIRDSATNA